ncbi:MAG: FkbM family methyltransferase [Dehalobacter sp. 4CP]|uniref:FkbM family methyltransferase n=1 Tax=Dehalobacter sp. CP TaxID=2594474 RepID=UPI0013C80666|nr:FkbM family methyltransferase [Dehalobacter sp. 4CP]
MKLNDAFKRISKNELLRESVIDLCRKVEDYLEYEGDIREEITGPILDEMYCSNSIIRKQLQNGLIFDFFYRTKIARDFILSKPKLPDHVWEPQTTKLLIHLSKKANNVIIGGAYFGDQTIILCKELSSKGGICHAFEPNSDQFERLNHNAKINELNNLRSWNQPLWCDSNSQLNLVGEDSYAFVQKVSFDKKNSEPAQGLQTISIDDYILREGIGMVDLIMLDIEGAEENVLRGASNLLKQHPSVPTIVFEVHKNYVNWDNGLENSDIVCFLKSCGYGHIYAIRDYNSNVNMGESPIELIPCDRVYLEGPPHGFNMIAVKDQSIVMEENFRICYDVSPKLLKHKDPKIHSPLYL